MKSPYLTSIREIRSSVTTQILQEKVLEALETVVVPDGWFIQRNASSILYMKSKRRLPHIKVYYDRYRVDVDEGSGFKVKSTREEFTTAAEMVKYVQGQFWHFSQ